jgi:hypothetical protein
MVKSQKRSSAFFRNEPSYLSKVGPLLLKHHDHQYGLQVISTQIYLIN